MAKDKSSTKSNKIQEAYNVFQNKMIKIKKEQKKILDLVVNRKDKKKIIEIKQRIKEI